MNYLQHNKNAPVGPPVVGKAAEAAGTTGSQVTLNQAKTQPLAQNPKMAINYNSNEFGPPNRGQVAGTVKVAAPEKPHEKNEDRHP